MESKKKIYDLLPPSFYPKTILVKANEPREELLQKLRENNLIFPLIAKPDIGGRGRGVKKIDSEAELINYLKKFPVDMLVQEFIS